jgi:hypothetical protein
MSGDKTINLKGDSFPARYRILEKPGVGGDLSGGK